ncbi:hypothetical protein C8R44DRAFT_861554 [Mycena epipterygia]|nr:hypothetical protein C8R44DRAFT_861554 [Mycena epipterygia]
MFSLGSIGSGDTHRKSFTHSESSLLFADAPSPSRVPYRRCANLRAHVHSIDGPLSALAVWFGVHDRDSEWAVQERLRLLVVFTSISAQRWYRHRRALRNRHYQVAIVDIRRRPASIENWSAKRNQRRVEKAELSGPSGGKVRFGNRFSEYLNLNRKFGSAFGGEQARSNAEPKNSSARVFIHRKTHLNLLFEANSKQFRC